MPVWAAQPGEVQYVSTQPNQVAQPVWAAQQRQEAGLPPQQQWNAAPAPTQPTRVLAQPAPKRPVVKKKQTKKYLTKGTLWSRKLVRCKKQILKLKKNFQQFRIM